MPSPPDYPGVKDPIRAVLRLLCGGHEPPDFVQGYDYSNLTDLERSELQDWVCCHLDSEIYWSTGIGVIEAAESIVGEALGNANIVEGQ